jgi:hypothetical protein
VTGCVRLEGKGGVFAAEQKVQSGPDELVERIAAVLASAA